MTAGRLRERVAFAYRDQVDDGFGNPVSGDWVEGPAFAAEIKPLRGGEAIQAARLAGRQPVVITVRACEDTLRVKVEWRAHDVRKDIYYNIRSIVNPDERRRYLDMECDGGVVV